MDSSLRRTLIQRRLFADGVASGLRVNFVIGRCFGHIPWSGFAAALQISSSFFSLLSSNLCLSIKHVFFSSRSTLFAAKILL